MRTYAYQAKIFMSTHCTSCFFRREENKIRTMTTEDWSLSDDQRADTVSRIKESMATMTFFSSHSDLNQCQLDAIATTIEKKAYTVAKVEAKTTTGTRPHHETLKAYARKLSALVLEVVSGKLDTSGMQGKGAEESDSVNLTGAREFLTHETAEEALASMLMPNAQVTTIKFSTKSFGVDAAQVAAKAIRNVASTLKHADMSDIIAGRPEDEALKALTIISEALGEAELETLDLSDNALGEKGIRACAAAFTSQKSLKKIAFQNVGCSVHGCKAVCELLQHCGEMRCIHLLNNMSGDEGATYIARVVKRCPKLEDFKMASSRVGADGGVALAQALFSCGSRLRSLDLHDNPLTHECARELALVIENHMDLVKLNLNDTCMEDDGIAVIAAGLTKGAAALESLELELNEITPRGASVLAPAISSMKMLRYLNMKENELDDDGALEIAKGIVGLKNLESIDVCTNQIKTGGALALAKACITLPKVQKLLMDDNEISEAGIESMMAILEKGRKKDILGSLEENCPDGEDDGEAEGHEELDRAVDDLVNALEKEHI